MVMLMMMMMMMLRLVLCRLNAFDRSHPAISMQSPYSPSVAPCQDVQCCECGIWFGSDELAKLHTRLFHPTRNVDVLLPPSLSKPRLQKRFKGPTGRVMQGLLTLFCSAHSKSNTLKEKVTQDSQTTAVVVLPLSRPVSRLSASSESRPPPHHTAGVYNVGSSDLVSSEVLAQI